MPYFTKYVVKDDVDLLKKPDPEQELPFPPYSTTSLAKSLKLDDKDTSAVDKRVLYEVTGLRYDETLYNDETSDDENDQD